MREVLTHTKRRNFQNCPRYYLHAHLQNLTPRVQRPGRRRGTIFGQALEFLVQEHHSEDFDAGVYAMAFVELQYDQLMAENVDAHDVAELEVELYKVAVMAEKYVERYGFDERREIEFRMPLINPSTRRNSSAFMLGGKIDGVAWTDNLNGKEVVTMIEDKFVGSIQRPMILRLPLDSQISEYVDAFLQMGKDCRVFYRHTRVPGINPLPAKQFKTKDNYPGETLTEYADRLRLDIDENPDKYFDQQILHFPREHLEDYRAGRWGIAQQILAARRVWRKNGELNKAVQQAFPMNSSRCFEYGGCEFIPLCTKQEGAMDLYVVQADNPELSNPADSGAEDAT